MENNDIITEQNDNEITTENAVTTEEVSDEAEQKKSSFPTQTVLTIRAIVGGYVAYLAYQIITSKEEVTPLMWVAVAVFIVAGAGLVITSVKHFICGEYEGGKKDV